MAAILRLGYQNALEQFKLADSTEKDGLETLSHVMRGDQICLLARKVAFVDSGDPWSGKIRDLLIEQAKKLPSARIGREEMSVLAYLGHVRSLAEDAEKGTAKQISEALMSLKETKVYPRNEREIFFIIEAQKQIRTLSTVFNFCRDVEVLYNPAPTLNGDEVILAKPSKGQIARLRSQLSEIGTEKKYQALEVAKLQIEEMEANLKEPLEISRKAPKEEARPKEEPVPKSRTWTWIAATAVMTVAIGVLLTNRFQ